MASDDPGRKVTIQVSMSARLLDEVDRIADTKKERDDQKANRSRVIRGWIREGIERLGKGAER